MSASKQLTATEVIDLFRALNLPVTDDGQQIDAKGKELSPFYLRMKNSPDGQKRSQADAWFKNLKRLQNGRDALLTTIQQQFDDLASMALSSAREAGMKKLTQALYSQLETIALKACNCDPLLARHFVDRFLQQEKIELAGDIVFPRLVERLEATAVVGQIDISWQLPTEECDEVIVKRFSLTKQGHFSRRGQELDRGRLSQYSDRSVEPGVRYLYELYSVWKKSVSQSAVAVEAVAIGEASQLGWQWEDGAVRLSWQKPSAVSQTWIFRASSPLAPVQQGVADPFPDNLSASRVYVGPETTWRDTAVVPGQTYHYLLVAYFAPYHFSNGVALSLQAPVPPPAVMRATAVYAEGGIHLHWEPIDDQRVRYVVVRRRGSTPPERVRGEDIITTTSQPYCVDDQVAAGERYRYAVFTELEGLYSLTGTVTAAVDVLAEVQGLQVDTGDGTVEIQWHPPDNVSRVVVRRHTEPPADHTAGEGVRLTGSNRAKDEGLSNGRSYHYLVCCVYRPDGVTEVVSPGVRIAATPERLPDPVTNFQVGVQGTAVLSHWTPSEFGQTVLVRSAKALDLAIGQRLPTALLDDLGEHITTDKDRALDPQPDSLHPYYTVFTVAGSHAVVGGSGSCVVTSDVTDLQLTATRSGVTLRWAWPPDCTAVIVSRRSDGWPVSPDDPQGTNILYTRAEYAAAGEKFVDIIQANRERFHYIVYARASGAPGHFFAPGTDLGCRAVIQWEPWMTLRYQLEPELQERALRLKWEVEDANPHFSGFVLIASQSEVPDAPYDGVELFRWAPENGQINGAHEALVPLEMIRQRRWTYFFAKSMVIDPAQRHTTLLIHPNTCLPISDQGEIQEDGGNGIHKPVGYQAGVPQKVICPHCFDSFGIEEMLFSGYGSDEVQQARYTRLDRLMKRPLRPPKNKQGKLLTRKLCPRHQHPLPYTAGTQSNLVVGLIGAKFSGKSHYIASLIHRLAGQVGADLQATLLPVTDDTQERYRTEFYEPLFGDGLELPLTTGTPPPLIYDLSLDGRLFGEKQNRSVTLAFYDTAGENLQDRETARQMVQYLRVASGVIFLVDPLQVPAVYQTLPPSMRPEILDHTAAPQQIIANVLQLLEDGRVLAANEPLSIPIAVVLTKADVLRDSGLIPTNRLWQSDQRHIGYFDRQAHADMNGMVGEYLRRWSQATYQAIKLRFSYHAFFAASATGSASDPETRRFKYISPWRVEDPLLWLLAELGVIPARY